MTLVKDRPADGFAAARKAMVESQLRVSGVNADFVRERMGAVAREDFVPAETRAVAYMDRAVPLGNGRFLAAPLVHGRILEEAAPTPADKVLLVHGGSLYLAELLRPLVGSLEVISAAEGVQASGKTGDYTLLIIDGAIEHLPDGLAAQLAEGGRVVAGLVARGLTRLATGRKVAGEVSLIPLAEIGMPILPEFAAAKGWSF
ncbi:MAG: protein-L-isoaspartate O-methyltransferase [Candidatus Andeanibacterium colombiense]|uniref:Protein-L-isoaspartate O-methyltransferase n=1 Tax=Candidatus Andeanibacterium colombiense TaxID=3121345 RepID=A0AAJ6BLX1_9SPHN|nr:MAG: protein-L-isoaspartate O-methyltransferase [Sphingomonadaceae bacterium]